MEYIKTIDSHQKQIIEKNYKIQKLEEENN